MALFSSKKEEKDIKQLLKMLCNKELRNRNQAARELLKIGEPCASGLVSLLGSEDLHSQDMAARILKRLNTKALPALNYAIQKSPFDVQEKIVHILGEIKDEAALSTLYEVLKGDNYKLRILTAQVLGKSKKPKVVSHLLVALNDSDPDVRIAAVNALSRFREPKTYAHIADLLNDAEINVRIAAAETLGKIKDPSTIPELVDALHDSFWWYGRDDAIQLLLKVIASFGRSALDELLKAIKSKDPTVRRYVIELLRPMRELRVISTLEMSLYDTNYDVAETALNALLDFGEGTLPILAEALASPTVWIRERAAWGLGEIGGQQAISYLLETLNDEANSVRKEAISSLARLKDSSALPTLRTLSLNRDNKEISQLARQAIAAIEAP